MKGHKCSLATRAYGTRTLGLGRAAIVDLRVKCKMVEKGSISVKVGGLNATVVRVDKKD